MPPTEIQEPPKPATPAPVVPDSDAPDPVVAQTIALIKPWIEFVPRRQRRLGLFIFIALLLHFTAFLFISIATTRATSWHPPRPRVSIDDTASPVGVLPDEPSGDSFAAELSDPRLFIEPPPAALPTGEPGAEVTDIHPNVGTPDFPSAAQPGDFQFVHPVITPLEVRAEDALHPQRQPFTYEEEPAPIADKTTWQWDPALALRSPAGVTDLPSPVSDTDLAPTQLSLAVSPDGTVQDAFVDLLERNPESGAGRLDLDQLAVAAARKIRFQATDQPGLVWGRVTVFWHYSASPRDVVVPTPTAPP